MADKKQQGKKTLTLNIKPGTQKSGEGEQVRQSFSHGRTKTVEVEVKRKRVTLSADARAAVASAANKKAGRSQGKLTEGELEARMRAVQEALKTQALEAAERARREEEEQHWRDEELKRRAEEQEHLKRLESPVTETPTETESAQNTTEQPEEKPHTSPPTVATEEVVPEDSHAQKRSAATHKETRFHKDDDEDTEDNRQTVAGPRPERRPTSPASPRKETDGPRKLNRTLISRALSGEGIERGRSMASLRRARKKYRPTETASIERDKIVREVIIPELITVSELANRMAVRSAEVVKALMKLGMMVTINQAIDADTAELICTEFGHTPKRVSESDIEVGLKGPEDKQEDMIPRAPVVTVMGHVDHGKTSLLDALRRTNVVAKEAGGITQHIGAYQVHLPSGEKITFVDTPGHEAFTQMRSRGASVTDVVVLVVAADDGVMPQTVEAINHARAANVPIIVAINKIDKPEAQPERVRNELLNHNIVLESLGGDVMSVEVSAKAGLNLDKLEEAIVLQAEILELKANPNRTAAGVIIDAKVDRGRGTVATVLIQHGTLNKGDLFVAGQEYGRVRALISDVGKDITQATPAMPVEILGFNGVPAAGDEFFVVENEARAREIAEYRRRVTRDAKAAAVKGSMGQFMDRISASELRELAVVVKADVQGSLEAIVQSLEKLSTDEVAIRVLHGAVGSINESDVTLARASDGILIGFNVRANPQARDLVRRDSVDLRYYSIIYDVIDDVKALMSGLLAPTLREKYLGSAEIREVFNVSKVGRVSGCFISDGVVKRGAGVRLLRDNVVIHEGKLKTLRRFKDEAKEVKAGYECGMAFENYNDLIPGDVIECFEIESVARQL